MEPRRRFLLYCQTLTGTGHFVKTHEIARALAPHHQVALVDGARPVPRSARGPAVERIELPRLRRVAGRLAPADPAASLPEVMGERGRLLAAAVDRIRPDALLIDQYPFFKWDLHPEVVPLIEQARAAHPDVRVVCSTWELPRGTGFDARAPSPEKVQEVFARHFDGLLIHADPRLLALETYIPWADRLGVPRVYTGYVSEKPPGPAAGDRPTSDARRRLVVVSTGGASLPGLLRDSAEAWRRIQARGAADGRTMVLFRSPFEDEDAPAPRSGSAGLPGAPGPDGAAPDGASLEERPFSPDFLRWLAAADLSISQAGYNTCTNILETRVRAILVPNPATLDQVARARRLAELGLACVLDPAEAGPERLAQAIVDSLAAPPPRHDLDLDGAETTRRRLEELIDGRPWPSPA